MYLFLITSSSLCVFCLLFVRKIYELFVCVFLTSFRYIYYFIRHIGLSLSVSLFSYGLVCFFHGLEERASTIHPAVKTCIKRRRQRKKRKTKEELKIFSSFSSTIWYELLPVNHRYSILFWLCIVRLMFERSFWHFLLIIFHFFIVFSNRNKFSTPERTNAYTIV